MADRRISAPLVLGVTALLFLLAAPAALAVKAPSLASSAQYKAFVQYVEKMEERSSQPTSTETKDAFEAKLTAKKTAAAHKANALFKRASEEVKAEAEETAKEQVERVRAKEGKALEALAAESAGKLERLEASYHVKFEHMVSGHRHREKALKRQIAELRAEKAEAAPGPPKNRSNEHWNKAFEEKKAALNATRENRLGYLAQKLEQGRAAIAAMPSTG
jgi:hypothetical protein